MIRDIENLILQEPGLASDHIPNFGEMVLPVKIGSGASRMSKAYRMTRTGFTLLAMGFTGEKALRFKLRYIAAFDELEARMRAAQTVNLNDPSQLRALLLSYSDKAEQLEARRSELQPPMGCDAHRPLSHVQKGLAPDVRFA